MEFDELYETFKDMVYNLALNYVQNTEDAEEITQDVFVAVFKSLKTFDGRSSISTWVYRIAINKSLDFIRASSRKKKLGRIFSLFTGDAREPQFSDFNHPGIQLESKEALVKLFGFINDLPANQKTALLLSKTEQKSQKEIAEIMGITPKAAESLIQRAKANLSAKLKQNEG